MTSGSYEEQFGHEERRFWQLTRIPVLLILGWFSVSHLFFKAEWVFIDNVNLLLHEGGHFLFSWGGVAIHALGGTLGQVMWPALFAVYFWFWRHERFASAVCAWWFFENFLNIARYMNDAPIEALPLVGGDTHDWNFLFTRWHVLHKAQLIGGVVKWVGVVGMVSTLVLLIVWTLWPRRDQIRSSQLEG